MEEKKDSRIDRPDEDPVDTMRVSDGAGEGVLWKKIKVSDETPHGYSDAAAVKAESPLPRTKIRESSMTGSTSEEGSVISDEASMWYGTTGTSTPSMAYKEQHEYILDPSKIVTKRDIMAVFEAMQLKFSIIDEEPVPDHLRLAFERGLLERK
tara:strand:- start:290 stop:748 length:459 start_codon:yes stop_codon:yes gene_type:complete